jgi:HSP20 family protein
MNVVSWTPFRDMEGIFDRYNRLLGNRALSGFEDKEWDWRPTADISETKKHYLIKAELPEVDKDDVQVAVENGVLTISGERHFEKDEETETQHRIECVYGKFSRSFTLPSDVDETKTKVEQKAPKPIEISVE